MKHANTLLSILAVIVLAGVGYHVIKQNKEYTKDTEKTFVEEVIDENGETQEVELEYPLTESFSSAGSNVENNLVIVKNNAQKQQYSVVKNTLYKAAATPFTFGFYYLDTINKHGIDKCKLSDDDTDDSEDVREYTNDNFKLSEISIVGKTAYLTVDADEAPKKTCASIVYFKDFKDTLFDAIHVIVK